MLTTLTCLSGMYCGTGLSLNVMNNFLIKHNMIQTLRGKKFLVRPEIIESGCMYKIYKEGIVFDDDGETRQNYHCIKKGYTFTMQNEPSHYDNIDFFGCLPKIDFLCYLSKCELFGNQDSKKLNTDEKKLYDLCKSENGTKIEYSTPIKTGDVWYLCDKNNNCSILAITDKQNFRKMVMEKHEFPFLITSFVMFCILSLWCFVRWLDSDEKDCDCYRFGGGGEKDCNCNRC